MPLSLYSIERALLFDKRRRKLKKLSNNMAMVAANMLSAIAIEMRQLQNKIQERRIVLNFFLRNVRTKNFAIKEVHIDVAKEIVRA